MLNSQVNHCSDQDSQITNLHPLLGDAHVRGVFRK